MAGTTLYMTGSYSLSYISRSDDTSITSITWASESGQSTSSATLNPVFILLFPATVNGNNSVPVAVNNFVTAVNTPSGQPLVSSSGQQSQTVSCYPFSQRAGGAPQPISDWNSSTVVFSSGDTLLIPLTQSLPTSANLNGFFDAINSAANLPATTSSSSATSATPVASPTSPTVTPTSTTTQPPPSSSTVPPAPAPSQNTGAIAGGVVGGVAGLAIIASIVLLLWRRQRQKTTKHSPDAVPYLSEVGQPGSGTPGFQGSTYSPRSLRTDGSLRQSGGW